ASGRVTTLKFSSDLASLLAAIRLGDGTNILLMVDVASGEAHSSQPHPGMVTALAFSPDGKLVAGTSRDGVARLWEFPSLVQVGTLRGHSGYVTSVAFTPDGRTLATASNDGTVKLWAVQSLQELCTMPGHIAPWTRLAFSPNNTELVGCGE